MMRLAAASTFLLATACAAASSGGGSTLPAPGAAAPAVSPPAQPREHGKAVVLVLPPLMHFQLDRRDTVALQLPNGATQNQVIQWNAGLDVQGSAETGGYRVVITLDSLTITASIPVPQAGLDSAQGTRWTAHLSPDGTLTNVEPDRDNSIVNQFGAMLHLLFPPLPGSDLRAGAAWTDSSTVATRAQNFDVQEQRRTEYTASGPAVHGADKVFVISGSGTFTRSGAATQFGQEMHHESTGQRRVSYYLGTDGTPVGMDGAETSKVTITVPAVGQSIDAEQRSSFRVTPVTAP
jgi:hypothetical protein